MGGNGNPAAPTTQQQFQRNDFFSGLLNPVRKATGQTPVNSDLSHMVNPPASTTSPAAGWSDQQKASVSGLWGMAGGNTTALQNYMYPKPTSGLWGNQPQATPMMQPGIVKTGYGWS